MEKRVFTAAARLQSRSVSGPAVRGTLLQGENATWEFTAKPAAGLRINKDGARGPTCCLVSVSGARRGELHQKTPEDFWFNEIQTQFNTSRSFWFEATADVTPRGAGSVGVPVN